MRKFEEIIRDWLLPGAIVFGISLYLFYRYTSFLHPWGHFLGVAASEGQRLVIFTLLFFQFVKVSPHDLGIVRWHYKALLFQILSFSLLAVLTVFTKDDGKMLLECAMICLICPTASAAGVITERLGGKINENVSYLVLINLAATFLIPMVIPLISPSDELSFWAYVGHLALKVFPMLILPCALAWLIRYTAPRLQRRLMRLSRYAFYVWGVGLTLAMVMSTRALLLSRLSAGAIAMIVVVSMAACFGQFFLGRKSEKDRVESLTAGQAMGQKNTGFMIWLGYNYLTPVTSVAGGLYAIWQNLFNSWELYRKEHPKS
ncbi:MAG: transporter, partial [Bacteroidales bacterium]|nr:transporter [Bacteroidales bacterium]